MQIQKNSGPLTGTHDDAQYREVRSRLQEIRDLQAAASVLKWDRATYMPAGGAVARGQQIATLRKLAHDKLTDPALGELLENLRDFERSLPYESDDASIVRLARRDFDRASRIPSSFIATLASHQTETYMAWSRAKPEGNFEAVRPFLEKTLELSRQWASFFPESDRVADPLIAEEDEGMTTQTIQGLFETLRSQLVPLVDAIAERPPLDDRILSQDFDETTQLNFCYKVIDRVGYDFDRGRLDRTLHPFATRLSHGDVRIATRVRPNQLTESLFSSLHEMGHALYEQGIDPALDGTPLARGTSAGMHEGQARLWENFIGRSRAFWECFYPWLQGMFLRQLGQVPVNDFYRAINKVERTPIRTAADEVTYNLHAIVRFDLEVAMLEGHLAVKDLPEAWNERYRQDLGIVPQNHTEGVLQDVHWFVETIGGQFQGYTLGNLIAAQLYESALKIHPEIPVDIERGNFETLHGWLRRNIYRHGRKFTANESILRVTGKPLHVDPFIRYLRRKYGDLYAIAWD
ncbi:carboxypeptidase M32 [Baaleninema simplex]|uniref:carboxypeptidase M32 n=1 Tax=Baaleninema simplex TaxID=2862350 RepID=UPI00034A1916|nr:carboxypeptidase M32 [Baaleninema simplex]